MTRKYTITFAFESGEPTTEVFHSKKAAKEYCQHIGATYRHRRLFVEIVVEGGGSRQSEAFVKEPRVQAATDIKFDS
jgi:hypothetical protein